VPPTSEPVASMIDRIRVAAVQLQAHDRMAFIHSLDRTMAEIRRAASQNDLVVLPEATFPAYVLGSTRIDETLVTRALDSVREIARESGAVIVAGAAVPVDGTLRNAALVVDSDGSLAGRADKLFLWHFDRRWFAPGDRLEPVRTRFGALGVMICADGRLPTIARALVDRGAVALVMPTAWVTSGRDPAALENVQADLLARVRAYENRVPFVAANKCGSELNMVAYCGKSQIIDSDGVIVAIAGERQSETLEATIAFDPRPAARTPLSAPRPCRGQLRKPVRLAISAHPLPADIDERLAVLDDEYALSPHDSARTALLEQSLPAASVRDDRVLDPAGLVAFRRAGYALIVWTTRLGSPWSERIARARALELRLYVVVFDEAMQRAFVADPDGTVVAGTFGDYQLASFAFDPRKTSQSMVAPGTDIGEGLERVEKVLGNAKS
jgi:predicted amidohydrolase